MQLLEETPAVLSLGKLCKDHRYSNESVSGQERRLTQNGKRIICKTDNVAPLVVPGLSVNYESSSSSTTPSPESVGPEASLASGNRAAARQSSDSVLGRSDGSSSGKLGQESWENDKKFHRQSDSHRSACTGRSACTNTHFSGFGFGTFYESGN